MTKSKHTIIVSILAIFLSSCTTTFYQVYQVKPSEKIETKENFLVYEDENSKITYDLWSEGGNIGFQFYNKTDKDINLDLSKSYFILNGIASNYYKNRVYTKTTSSSNLVAKSTNTSKAITGLNQLNLIQTNNIQASQTSSLKLISGNSISISEEKVITIPAKTSKLITEYNVNQSLYRDCDLFKYPTKKQIQPKSFSQSTSPINFSNRITYRLEDSEELIKIENTFYVSMITNYPANEFIQSTYPEFCGQKSLVSEKQFIGISPSKFFIKYVKDQDTWKH